MLILYFYILAVIAYSQDCTSYTDLQILLRLAVNTRGVADGLSNVFSM